MRRIYVKHGMTTKLAKLFRVTDQTIRNALRGATEGEQPDRIRDEAIKQGGFYAQKPRI